MTGTQLDLVAEVVFGIALAAGAVVMLRRFVLFCLADLDRTPVVRTLPRDTWRLLIVLLIPLGGLLYLRYGRIR